MTLGEKIQDLRRRNAMSQDVLAEKLEVSRQAVSKWERDEAIPETDKIVRIAQLFAVSTDYLLMQEPEQPKQQPQPQQYAQQTRPTAANRLERFVRRHGYKGGYVLIGIGVVLCLVGLTAMLLIPAVASAFAGKPQEGELNSGIQGRIFIDGELPQGVLDQIYDQMGDPTYPGGIFDSMENAYNQQVDQMMSAWQSGVRIIAAMFGVPVLLVGVGLIVLGTVVVVKGKKIASER